ncbi:hypothetical protein D3C87_242150 [compost metagenome]
MTTSRRQFIKLGTGTLAGLCLSRHYAVAMSAAKELSQQAANPMRLIDLSQFNTTDFTGDDINKPHDILWNIDGYIQKKGGLPAIEGDFETIIVGGGIAGLTAAYELRDKKPLLLEQSPRFGGNSQGEIYGQSAFSIGAAYIVAPDEQSRMGQMLIDIGLLGKGRVEFSDNTTVLFHQDLINSFWTKGVQPQDAAGTKKVFDKLVEIRDNWDLDPLSAQGQVLNRMSFEQWLSQEIPDCPESVKEYFQLYCWSSFCASIDEIAASNMLGYLCDETTALMAFPGGNSAIAEGLYRKLRRELPKGHLQNDAMVMRVEVDGDSVVVLFEDAVGVLRRVRAKAVVMACQKFVARRLLPQLPADQDKAIQSIRYRGYLVANVIFKKQIQSPSFELYCLKGDVPPAPSTMRPPKRGFTDICFGSWAQGDNVQNGILTLYKGLPMDGTRQFMFKPGYHEKIKGQIMAELPYVLKGLNLKESDILGMRLTRWGHSLPLAEVGIHSNGVMEKINQPLGGRIFFANQDSAIDPCFESAVATVYEATDAIRSLLK